LSGDVTLDSFPDPLTTVEEKAAFTAEETIAFIKSQGTVVPDRFMHRDSAPTNNGNVEVQEHDAGSMPSIADLPL
jgi:hypothetical protein